MPINAASAYNPMIRRAPVRAGGGDPTPVAMPPVSPTHPNNQQDKVQRVANDVTVVAAAATGLVATLAGLFGHHSDSPAPTAAPAAPPVVATPQPVVAPVAAPKPATPTVNATSSGGMQAFGQMMSNFFSGIVNFFKSLFGAH